MNCSLGNPYCGWVTLKSTAFLQRTRVLDWHRLDGHLRLGTSRFQPRLWWHKKAGQKWMARRLARFLPSMECDLTAARVASSRGPGLWEGDCFVTRHVGARHMPFLTQDA